MDTGLRRCDGFNNGRNWARVPKKSDQAEGSNVSRKNALAVCHSGVWRNPD